MVITTAEGNHDLIGIASSFVRHATRIVRGPDCIVCYYGFFIRHYYIVDVSRVMPHAMRMVHLAEHIA